MADKTIPQLTQETEIDSNSIFVFDSGVETFKILAPDVARGLSPLYVKPVIAEKSSLYSPTVVQDGGVIPLNSASGAFNIQLPNPSTMTGRTFVLKDQGGMLSTYNVTLLRYASEMIEKIAADFALRADYGSWKIFSDGVNWKFI